MKSYTYKVVSIFSLTVVFFALDYFANRLYLYWTIGWLDSLMHFIGGVLVSLFVLTVFDALYGVLVAKPWLVLVWLVAGVLVVGAGWEIAEYGLGISHYSPGFISDTISDVSMDMLGALIVWYGALLIYKK
jgi:uncharacterized BrkB/YihY/UPF0761 family membrane protein